MYGPGRTRKEGKDRAAIKKQVEITRLEYDNSDVTETAVLSASHLWKENRMNGEHSTTSSDLVQQSINTIRFLSVDAVQKANSGHPGLPLDAAPMGYVLWTRFLKHNPTNPKWFNRDRFVLSAGHG